MGFDTDPTNDFKASDGTVYPVNSSWSTLHEFGESYKVSEFHSTFSNDVIKAQIASDIQSASDFVPVYAATFPTEEKRMEAERLCKNDTGCILDVSLVGTFIADTYEYLRQIAPDVDLMNEFSLAVLHENLFSVDNVTTPAIFDDVKTTPAFVDDVQTTPAIPAIVDNHTTPLPSPKRGLVLTTSSTSCTPSAPSCTGTSVRVWRKASSPRPARISRPSRRTTKRSASTPPRARARARRASTKRSPLRLVHPRML